MRVLTIVMTWLNGAFIVCGVTVILSGGPMSANAMTPYQRGVTDVFLLAFFIVNCALLGQHAKGKRDE